MTIYIIGKQVIKERDTMNPAFTIIKELRYNHVHNRYLVVDFKGDYLIHATTTKLNIGDTMNVISPVARGSRKYLLKTYN